MPYHHRNIVPKNIFMTLLKKNRWAIKQCSQSCSELWPGREIRKIILFSLLSCPSWKGLSLSTIRNSPTCCCQDQYRCLAPRCIHGEGRKQMNKGNELKQRWTWKHKNRHCSKKPISWCLAWSLPYLSLILIRMFKSAFQEVAGMGQSGRGGGGR